VEDRLAPGLYLEMTDLSPDLYAAERVAPVLSLPGVEGATWWANQRPGRDEFPRSLPEFETLGVYEVGDAFRAPLTPTGIRGHHFRRTPRPAQGCLSGRPTLGVELVLVSPKSPEAAQEFRDWADFVHIRHIAASAVEGFTMITPYENATGGLPRFLHFYEMDTAEAEEAFQRMTPSTLARIGGPGTAAFAEWAGHPQLVIDYVNTFTRIGEKR